MQLIYKGGYKYQVCYDYEHKLPAYMPRIGRELETQFLWMCPDRILVIRAGYAWDGPSGPTWDTPAFMRGSLVHDALYQLMRLGYLEEQVFRPLADRVLKDMCIEDGMWPLRARYVYYAVRWFAGSAAKKGTENPWITTP